MLVGTWYIIQEGRSYRVGNEVDKYEEKTIGAKRRGKINPDYLSYEAWVAKHSRGRKE